MINKETRQKLSILVLYGLIKTDLLLDYYTRPNKKKLKKIVCSQFNLNKEVLINFKSKVFDSFTSLETIYDDDEIIILNHLINNNFCLTRKELLIKTKLSQSKLSQGIEGLIEEKMIDVILFNNNEKLIFIDVKKYKELSYNE